MAARLSLDALRAVRTRRETYVGPWLPEPISPDDARAFGAETPSQHSELASDLSMALMHVLERLSPEERAALILHDAFEKNYRVGVMANSDGHKGRPGACYPGASFFGSMGGLTCFLADKLDRDGIFDAMRRRHHYGTTGNRAFADVSVALKSDGAVFDRDPALQKTRSQTTRRLIMGDIAHVKDDTVEWHIDVAGSAPIERLDLYDGRETLETIRPYEAKQLGRRVRLVYEGAEYRGRARTTIWDGSIEIAGNRILRAEVINNWNLDRGIQEQTDSAVRFKAVTTGNYGAIDLWLAEDGGTLRFKTVPASGEVEIKSLGVEPRVFKAGGLDRAVSVQRLPETMTTSRLTLKRPITLRREGDTRLYIRMQQEDGHRLWTSPVYLFRE